MMLSVLFKDIFGFGPQAIPSRSSTYISESNTSFGSLHWLKLSSSQTERTVHSKRERNNSFLSSLFVSTIRNGMLLS